MTFVVGLTGGIATGKSTIARHFQKLGAPVFYADDYVHKLLAPGGIAVADILEYFPETKNAEGGIDRVALGNRVFTDDLALERLEEILHPLVRQGEEEFITEMREAYIPVCVLEVPLLYETRADAICDITIVTDCNEALQRERALARPHMTEEKLEQVLSRQLGREVRRQKADIIINTELGEEQSFALVEQLVHTLTSDA